MKIIMIRHGQTEWNALEKYQGQTDIDLNEVGREQAEKLAVYWREHKPEVEAIYCSDLSRSRETAVIIGRALQLKPIMDRRFREINFGNWEGLTYREVNEQYPRELDDWLHHTLQVRLSGGEAVDDVVARSMEGVRDIAARHQGTVIVVSHGGLIKILLNHLQAPYGKWKTYLASGSMTILDCREDKIKPVRIGATVTDLAG